MTLLIIIVILVLLFGGGGYYGYRGGYYGGGGFGIIGLILLILVLFLLFGGRSFAQTENTLAYPVGVAQRIITKTTLVLNTNTTVCPALVAGQVGMRTELIAGSAVGVGLNGQTLASATVGAGATAPDMAMTANQLYTLPNPASNAITAYGAVGVFVCIQTNRQ